MNMRMTEECVDIFQWQNIRFVCILSSGLFNWTMGVHVSHRVISFSPVNILPGTVINLLNVFDLLILCRLCLIAFREFCSFFLGNLPVPRTNTLLKRLDGCGWHVPSTLHTLSIHIHRWHSGQTLTGNGSTYLHTVINIIANKHVLKTRILLVFS